MSAFAKISKSDLSHAQADAEKYEHFSKHVMLVWAKGVGLGWEVRLFNALNIAFALYADFAPRFEAVKSPRCKKSDAERLRALFDRMDEALSQLFKDRALEPLSEDTFRAWTFFVFNSHRYGALCEHIHRHRRQIRAPLPQHLDFILQSPVLAGTLMPSICQHVARCIAMHRECSKLYLQRLRSHRHARTMGTSWHRYIASALKTAPKLKRELALVETFGDVELSDAKDALLELASKERVFSVPRKRKASESFEPDSPAKRPRPLTQTT